MPADVVIKNRSFSRRSLSRNVLARSASAAALLLALALGVPAYADKPPKQVSIEAQPLGDAIFELSQQTGATIFVNDRLVGGKSAKTLNGVYTVEEGLSRLLEGSGLSYRQTADGTYAVVQATAQITDRNGATPKPSDEPSLEIEEIVVTGTNIRGIAPESSPNFTLDREVIDNSGFVTVDQLLDSIPQNFGGGARPDTSGFLPVGDSVSNQFSSSTVNFRGLGSSSTLTLINGRRLAPIGDFGFVDVSMIPLTAVDRVEGVTDGSSAIYGSDAVGGVINFVLRDDFEGAETGIQYGTSTEGQYDTYQVSQTLGKNWGAGNALLSYEFFHESNLTIGDRDFTDGSGAPDNLDILPKNERHTVFGLFDQQLSSRVRLFGHVGYTDRDIERTSRNDAQRRAISNISTLFSTLGVEFDLGGDWRADIAGGYARTLTDTRTIDFVSGRDVTTDGRNALQTADAKVDGPLASIAGGEIRAAVGFQYRVEDFQKVEGLTARNVYSGFGEIFVPIFSDKNRIPFFERLELSSSVRFDHYTDIGESTTPKIGILWAPIEDLRLRASYGESFRAPGLVTYFPDASQRGTALINIDFAEAPNGTGRILALIDQGFGVEPLDPETATFWTGGFDFEPKRIPGLKLSSTYYLADYVNRIARPTANPFEPFSDPDRFQSLFVFNPSQDIILEAINNSSFFNGTSLPQFGPLDVPENAELYLDIKRRNIGATKTSGLDFSVDYSHEFGPGSLLYNISANYIFYFREALVNPGPSIDIVDTIFNPTELQVRGQLGWSGNSFSINAFVNHTGGYRNNSVVPEEKIDPWTTFDLNMAYTTGDNSSHLLLRNLRFALSIQNVFDKAPPFVVGAPAPFNNGNYDPANASPLGRYISLSLRKTF